MRPRLLSTIMLVLALGTPVLAEPGVPEFVGRDTCKQCHADQNAAWQGSHHDLAMQVATEQTVLGDFADTEFEQAGAVSRFYRDDGRFMVRTHGPDGALTDYPIQYTFGVYPLQQYLIAFPGGRLQALDIAWDARPASQGGQRWFHLHPEDPVLPGDVLHWTGPNLNWNYMCADCHSTNLKKNYDADSDSYDTTWSEVDVSCEACHGPGAGHVEWAEAWKRGAAEDRENKGLTVVLDERDQVAWRRDEATGKMVRSAPRTTDKEIQVCARCHSRRGQLDDQFVAGDRFLDSFRPALLTPGLYYPDGQIQDEVYVWGSFVQSRMYQAGVTCSDCHDPHTAELKAPGDEVCQQCHAADRYAAPEHHFHAPESDGASCVSCHMPSRNFMQVDARNDHSLRVPRPDLSVSLGTPNACNDCHTDKSPQWAADQAEQWYGRQPEGLQAYASALHAARHQLPDAARQLRALASATDQPAIARATALSHLGGYPGPRSQALIQQGLAANDPLQRLGALDALVGMDPRQQVAAFASLWDERRAVRVEAAQVLAGFPPERLPARARDKLAAGVEEYIAVQQFSAERPESQVNLAGVYTDRGRLVEAEQAYRRALELQHRFVPAYINYAQFMAEMSREKEVENLLREGLARVPETAAIEYSLGLSLIRQQDTEQGLVYIARAAKHAPGVARYSYVHAVALNSTGRLDQALAVLEEAHERHPTNIDILLALATFNRDAGRRAEAAGYASRLLGLYPDNPRVQQLARELGAD